MRTRIAGFVAVVQIILFLAHWFVYDTWTAFRGAADPPGINWLQVAIVILSVSFVGASLLAFRYDHLVLRAFYRLASIWVGTLNLLLPAAGLCWILYLAGRLAGVEAPRPALVAMIFGVAGLVSLYALFNARWIRVKRVTVALPNLPPSWRGRTGALVSDVHLGPVNGRGFMRRVAAKLKTLQPDIVFITGDLFDGTKVDASAVVAPLQDLAPKFGSYFVMGNHEEFGNPAAYATAITAAGVRVLNNEKATIEGLDIVGVHYGATTEPRRLRAILQRASLDGKRPSILLSHAPHALEIAESEGVSLQLSGHTHGGQLFPFTWLTRRIFRQYTYGLAPMGSLLVYTTSGAGTWGPPMRLGARPEIVSIEFA